VKGVTEILKLINILSRRYLGAGIDRDGRRHDVNFLQDARRSPGVRIDYGIERHEKHDDFGVKIGAGYEMMVVLGERVSEMEDLMEIFECLCRL
jgi:hypothetical protein